jgi:hypothetical protein
MNAVARKTDAAVPAVLEQLGAPEGIGDFFMVNRQNWNRSLALGMNEAIAHLWLARGTGPNQDETFWSTNSIEQRTGMSRSRARAAIGGLITAGIISEIGKPIKPKYKISLPAKEDWIVLPNSLVGELEEISPLDEVRETQCVRTLGVLVNFYASQFLPDEGGIDRRQVLIEYSKSCLARVGRYSVFGFKPGRMLLHHRASFMASHLPDIPRDEQISKVRCDLTRSIELLVELKLLEFVCHLVESDDDVAEILYPMPLPGTGVLAEQELSSAAKAASLSILNRAGINPADVSDCKLLVPLKMQHEFAQVVGVARLTHRPKTAMTQEWESRSVRWNAIAREYLEISANMH